MSLTKQQELWQGAFGDDYHTRNPNTDDEIDKRIAFWELVLKNFYGVCGVIPKSFLEIGAGQGPNLIALEKIGVRHGIPFKCYAVEVNQKARLALAEASKTIDILPQIPQVPVADLVFTYGVMIHTHPAHVRELQRSMVDASNRFVMCAEYFAPTTTPKPYRGESDALWLDDYGSLFLNNFPLAVVGCGFAWKRVSGLDNVTFWLLQKQGKMQ